MVPVGGTTSFANILENGSHRLQLAKADRARARLLRSPNFALDIGWSIDQDRVGGIGMHLLPKAIFAALAMLCAPVNPVFAQTTAYAVGQGSPNQIILSIPVTASVGGRCGFAAGSAPAGTYNQPNFDVTGLNHDFEFKLECTGPSRVAVVSANGGLLTGGALGLCDACAL